MLVTGAASGIGADVARIAAARGYAVVAADLALPAASALAESLGPPAFALELDVREPQSWARGLGELWERCGHLDVLVNNAGVHYPGWTLEMPPEQDAHMVAVNLVGLIHGCRATVPRMLEQGSGHVVNVASLAAFVPIPGQAVYSATKHAVRAFHYALEMELRGRPIGFTLVCPPAVETPMVDRQVVDDAAALTFADPSVTAPEVARQIVAAIESGRRDLLIPPARGRFLRAVGVQPAVTRALLPRAQARGRRNLEQRRRAP
jgi:short-subunit dehydrogenase